MAMVKKSDRLAKSSRSKLTDPLTLAKQRESASRSGWPA
jgi:hypothetical protein